MKSKVAAIGIDLGATRIKAGLVHEGAVLRSLVKNLREEDRTPDGVIECLAEAASDLLEEASSRNLMVIGAGVGIPGVIRFREGLIVQSPNFPKLRDFPAASLLANRLGLKVKVDNDANVVTLGEALYGAGKGVSHLALLTLGSGVGGGLFLGGRLYRGSEGMAGEVGHVVVEPEGEPCGCGGRGCLEQYASLNAMRRWARRDRLFDEEAAYLDPDLPKRLFNMAQGGDRRCASYFEEVGYRLAIAIGGLLNVLNLHMVILAGGIARAHPAFMPALMEALSGRAFRAVLASCQITTCALWEDGGILGAAALVLEDNE